MGKQVDAERQPWKRTRRQDKTPHQGSMSPDERRITNRKGESGSGSPPLRSRPKTQRFPKYSPATIRKMPQWRAARPGNEAGKAGDHDRLDRVAARRRGPHREGPG